MAVNKSTHRISDFRQCSCISLFSVVRRGIAASNPSIDGTVHAIGTIWFFSESSYISRRFEKTSCGVKPHPRSFEPPRIITTLGESRITSKSNRASICSESSPTTPLLMISTERELGGKSRLTWPTKKSVYGVEVSVFPKSPKDWKPTVRLSPSATTLTSEGAGRIEFACSRNLLQPFYTVLVVCVGGDGLGWSAERSTSPNRQALDSG